MERVGVKLTELLAGLAEEATEMAQAALKLRRVYDKSNPTDITEEWATYHLMEEIGDVELYLEQIPVNRVLIEIIKDRKLKRWKERLLQRTS